MVLKLTLTGVVFSHRILIFVRVSQFGILYLTGGVVYGRILIFARVLKFGILCLTVV